MIDFVESFLAGILASNSSNSSVSLSSLGVGNSSKSNFTIDLDVDMANNTIISAGFDASFRLGVSFKVTDFCVCNICLQLQLNFEQHFSVLTS